MTQVTLTLNVIVERTVLMTFNKLLYNMVYM